MLIERDGYHLNVYALQQDRCRGCGAAIAGRFGDRPGDWVARRQPVRIAAYAAAKSDTPTNCDSASCPTIPAPHVESSSPAGIEDFALTADQDRLIFRAAGRRVIAAVLGQTPVPLSQSLADLARLPVAGAFVTLKRAGVLRSCCGSLGRAAPLCRAIEHAAVAVAKEDRRFPPISAVELPYLEIDVLAVGEIGACPGPRFRGATRWSSASTA